MLLFQGVLVDVLVLFVLFVCDIAAEVGQETLMFSEAMGFVQDHLFGLVPIARNVVLLKAPFPPLYRLLATQLVDPQLGPLLFFGGKGEAELSAVEPEEEVVPAVVPQSEPGHEHPRSEL